MILLLSPAEGASASLAGTLSDAQLDAVVDQYNVSQLGTFRSELGADVSTDQLEGVADGHLNGSFSADQRTEIREMLRDGEVTLLESSTLDGILADLGLL